MAGMSHLHVLKSELYLEWYMYLNTTLTHQPNPLIEKSCLQGAIPSEYMTTIFNGLSKAWGVFPVLYKSVFFPDYLLSIKLFFLRGRWLPCLFHCRHSHSSLMFHWRPSTCKNKSNYNIADSIDSSLIF